MERFYQDAPRPGFIWSPESGSGGKQEFRKLLSTYEGSEVDQDSLHSSGCISMLFFIYKFLRLRYLLTETLQKFGAWTVLDIIFLVGTGTITARNTLEHYSEGQKQFRSLMLW
jgi:hypothetical protein